MGTSRGLNLQNDERCVWLGFLDPKNTAFDSKSPYVTRIGGQPAWYSNENMKKMGSVVCKNCQKNMLFIAQIYAPVDVPRTLYIYGCNSRDCCVLNGSWRVFRDVEVVIDEDNKKKLVHEELCSDMASITCAWDNTDDSDDDWGDTVGSEWGQQNVSGKMLDDLLVKRDASLQTTEQVSKMNTSTKKTSISSMTKCIADKVIETSTDVVQLPMVHMIIEEEPEENNGNEDYSYEKKLYEKYLQEEAGEEASASIVSQTGSQEPRATLVSSVMEGYERTPARDKWFQRFTNRVKRCPSQCLRYDYGGKPIWPSPTTNLPRVEKCPCGQERVFELQLMPALTYLIPFDRYATGRETSSDDRIGLGMDWGTIVVWVCPLNCKESQEEQIYAQPPVNQ